MKLLSLWTKFYRVTIQMESIRQYQEVLLLFLRVFLVKKIGWIFALRPTLENLKPKNEVRMEFFIFHSR